MTRFAGRPAGRPFADDYDARFVPGGPPSAAAALISTGPRTGTRYVRGLGRHLALDDADEDATRVREAVIERVRTGWARRDAPRLDVTRNEHEADVFSVTGEVLVRTESWPDLRPEAEAAGLVEVPLGHPELEGRILRLRRTGTQGGDLAALVRGWRGQGHAVSMSYVTPLGGRPIMKPYSGGVSATVATFDAYQESGPLHGEGVTVAVIDSGITAEVRTDGWLRDVERLPGDAPGTHGDDGNIDPLDADPQDGWLDVFAGHGTFVAGLVARVAPGARIRVYKAIGPGGAGDELDVACALVRAVRDGADVVNLSLGTQTLLDEPSLALGAALEVVREIEDERGSTAVIVSAAGNYGDTTPTWPAAFGRVVAVGGLTTDLRPTTWSSRGPWVDLSTVAEGIVSTFVRGSQNPAFGGGHTFEDNAFACWLGTSFAAPQVSGAVARTMTELGVDGPQAVRALLAAGKPVAGFGKALHILPGA